MRGALSKGLGGQLSYNLLLESKLHTSFNGDSPPLLPVNPTGCRYVSVLFFLFVASCKLQHFYRSAKLRKAAPISCKVTSLLVGNGVNHSYRYEFSLVFFDLFLILL